MKKQYLFKRLKHSGLTRLGFTMAALLFSLQLSAQLLNWNSTTYGTSFGPSPHTPNVIDPNLTVVTGLSRGASISASGTPAAGAWGGAGGWGTTDAGSVYFVFKANAGYQVSLSSIVGAVRRSASGPSPNYTISYSLDGGATYAVAGQFTLAGSSGNGTVNTLALSGIAALQNIQPGVEVRFRITFPNTGTNWYLMGANALQVTGTTSAIAAPCAVPTNLAENNVTATTADFNWDAAGTNDFQYVLNQSAADPSGAGTDLNGVSFSTASLSPSTTYYFHLRRKCGASSFSNWVMVNFTTPAAPCTATSGLAAANVTYNSADLSWTAQAGTGYQYVVDQVATAPAGAGTATTATTYNATGLTESTTYYLHVRTQCSAGVFSSWTTIPFTTIAQPCAATSGLAAANVTFNSADLSWTAQTGATYEYLVDQTATAPSGAGTATTATTYNVTGLTESTTYYVHVRTECSNGQFSPWTTISFTTIAQPCAATSGLAAANVTYNSADLSWTTQTGATYEYVVDQVSASPAIAGIATTATTYNATGLTESTTHYLHVRTECSNGQFSPWTTISFTTIAQPCAATSGLAAANVTFNSANLSWTAQGGASYEYAVNQTAAAPAGAGTATTATAYNATGLTESTTYYLHVRTECSNGQFSPWTTISFTTIAQPCAATSGLAAANVTFNSANLSWTAQTGATYEYVVDQTATAPAGAGTATTATAYNATGLTESTTYYLHVRTECSNGQFSPWTTISFTPIAQPCAATSGLAAANVTFNSANLSWTAQTGATYEYVVDQTATAPAGAGTATTATTYNATGLTELTTYYLHVRTECSNGQFSPWTTISFTTIAQPCAATSGLAAANVTYNSANLSWTAQTGATYEYVVDQVSTSPVIAGTATTATAYNATGLTESTTYYLHVRTQCSNGQFSAWTTISFTTIAQPCAATSGLAAANVTFNSANLSWTAQGGASYEYAVNQTAAAPTGAGTATTATAYSATGLTESTTYYLHVRTECSNGQFSPWTTISFTTTGEPCAAPTGLAAANITHNSADVSWNIQAGTIGFEYVMSTSASTPSGSGTASSTNAVAVTGLAQNTIYYLYVRTECANGEFSPWVTMSFQTLLSTVGLKETDAEEVIKVYPNPVSSQLTLKSVSGNGTAILMNTEGKQLAELPVEGTAVLEMADLPAGAYFVRFIQESKVVTVKVVKL